MDNIRDGLRHFENDLGEILPLLTEHDVTEIILNPYRLANNQYIGYILVERFGRKLTNLIKRQILPFNYEVKNTPQVLVSRNLKTNKINFWLEMFDDNLHQFITDIILAIKSEFMEDLIIQSSDASLLIYLDSLEYELTNITKSKYNLPNYIDIINLINLELANLKQDIYLSVFNRENINLPIHPTTMHTVSLVRLSMTKAETIMNVLASITNNFLHNKKPLLECQIPKYGHRFTGVIPPVVDFPAFCIRRHNNQIFTLDELVGQGVLKSSSRDTIISWIKRRFNILIAGGTGSGKTTLANAILQQIFIEFPSTRVVIIEDVAELKFNRQNSVGLTINEFFMMNDALRATLRFKPDRIVMGEVRGAEAYTLLKAWNTGHPGGVATIHANGVDEAIFRFESCIRDHQGVQINRSEIGFTINGIISIQNLTVRERLANGEYQNITKRRVTALRQIIGYDSDKDIYQDIIFDKEEEF